jgi:hypothetical protein
MSTRWAVSYRQQAFEVLEEARFSNVAVLAAAVTTVASALLPPVGADPSPAASAAASPAMFASAATTTSPTDPAHAAATTPTSTSVALVAPATSHAATISSGAAEAGAEGVPQSGALVNDDEIVVTGEVKGAELNIGFDIEFLSLNDCSIPLLPTQPKDPCDAGVPRSSYALIKVRTFPSPTVV